MVPSATPGLPDNPTSGGADTTLSTRRANREQLRGKPPVPGEGLASVAPVAPKQAAGRAGAAKRTKGRSLANVAVMTVAAGLVATMALPAYAFNAKDGQQEFTTSAADRMTIAQPQLIDAAGTTAPAAVTRDSITATTPEQLQEAREAAARAAAVAAREEARATWVVGVRAQGDDYPWWNASPSQLSPLRYYYRECVDFVAWRVNRDAGTPNGGWAYEWGRGLPSGSAYSWASGWQWGSGHTAIAGSVAWFSGNHVAYVSSVSGDGAVVLEEYNWGSARHSYNRRVVSANSVDLYLYPPGVG